MKDIHLWFFLAVFAFVLCTEIVSCQWHADNLTNGCRSNVTECAINALTKSPAK